MRAKGKEERRTERGERESIEGKTKVGDPQRVREALRCGGGDGGGVGG